MERSSHTAVDMSDYSGHTPAPCKQISSNSRTSVCYSPPRQLKKGGSILLQQIQVNANKSLTRVYLSEISMRLTLIFSCIGVLLDPLFFYIPTIDQTNKCLGIDTKLRTVALVSRSLIDILIVTTFALALMTYSTSCFDDSGVISDTILLGRLKPKLKKFVKGISQINTVWTFIFAIVSVLPIPQVAIALTFPKIQGSGYLSTRVLLNALLVFQYILRLYFIHRIMQGLRYFIRKWITATFNFFLYILAGHVLGALWYFFTIQRQTSCWDQACNGQMLNLLTPVKCLAYLCDDHNDYGSIQFRDDSCPTNQENNTQFDFGIYRELIKSGNTELKEFPTKYFYCFRWGLRNLSNFGADLETSSYVWETCFALLISIIGLLLFLYLIGNVQLFLQSKANQKTTFDEDERKRHEDERKRLEQEEKLDRLEKGLRDWMARHRIPDEMIMTDIMKNVKQMLGESNHANENGDVNLKYVMANLPWFLRKRVQRHLCMDALSKVPLLENMEEEVLKLTCDYLRPMIYEENQKIVQAGELAVLMFVVIEGRATCSEDASSDVATQLEKGDFFGEELLTWVSLSGPYIDRPISTKTVRSETKIEAFVLTVDDVMNLVRTRKFQRNLKRNSEFSQ